MIRLGWCSSVGLRIPCPCATGNLTSVRMMCQAAPVFPVPYLPVPERAPVRSGTERKTPDQSQAHHAFDVIRLGFEPKTHSLEGCCSIQLSYRTEP